MLEYEFTILDWAAYANGMSEQHQWLDWAAGLPQLPPIGAQSSPPLDEMPSMLRRRLGHLGRFACRVTWLCHQQSDLVPMVFASRYGDSERSLGLLADLVRGESLSPTSFGLSVHNAVSALYGIARGHTGNTIVVCAGRATVAAALTEAAALLSDGAPEVLVIYYESPLPPDYTAFQDENHGEYAWCWRIGPVQANKPHLRVCVEAGGGGQAFMDTPRWPSGLSLLRYVLRQMMSPVNAAPLVRHDRAGVQSTWSAHA